MATKPKIPAKGSVWTNPQTVAPFRSELSSLFPDEASLNAFLQNPNAGTQPWAVNPYLTSRLNEQKKLSDAYEKARQEWADYQKLADASPSSVDQTKLASLKDAAYTAYNAMTANPGSQTGWTTSGLNLVNPEGKQINQWTMQPVKPIEQYNPTKGPGPMPTIPTVPTSGSQDNPVFDWDAFKIQQDEARKKGLEIEPPMWAFDQLNKATPKVPVVGQTSPQTSTPTATGLLNTGPLNNYTQPFTMPKIGGGGNQAMKNLAGASMDLWDYKRPDYGGTSVTGAANWSDLLNFGG